MKVRPAALIVRDGAFLTMRYQYGDHYVHVLPGGNPDPGESLTEALSRELEEELGLDVTVGKMILAGEVLNFNHKEDTLHCVFQATINGAEPSLDTANTSAQAIEWVLSENLDALNLYPNFGPHLLNAKAPDLFSYTGPLMQIYRD